MSTSPVDPEDIRAAAEVQRDLGPEYNDAVVAAFIDRVDRAVEARVEARLAAERKRQPAVRGTRRALLKGVALGVGASALVAGASIAHTHAIMHEQARAIFCQAGQGCRVVKPGPGGLPGGPIPRPAPPAKPAS